MNNIQRKADAGNSNNNNNNNNNNNIQLKKKQKKFEEFSQSDTNNVVTEERTEWGNWRCCRYEALPEWLKDNEFLLRGYRPPLPSFRICFNSIFRLHTETGNIWTHLIGCLAFVMLAFYFVSRPSFEIDFQEKYIFSVFFIGAISCLGFSCIFHTVMCHSEKMSKLFSKLDYLGIALLITGTFVPWLYYAFYCDTGVRNFYMGLTFTLGTAAIIISLFDKFGHSRYRTLRTVIFAGFGLSGALPAVHILMAYGFAYAILNVHGGYLLMMAALYLVGAYMYAARIPERWYPGKFDIVFQSHQIFHVLVFVAALVSYRGMSLTATKILTEAKC